MASAWLHVYSDREGEWTVYDDDHGETWTAETPLDAVRQALAWLFPDAYKGDSANGD